MNHTPTRNMTLPFDWNTVATVSEKQFLEQHGLQITDPIEMYMEFRAAGNLQPNTDSDFGAFFDFVHVHLEALYEGMGYDDSTPMFGRSGLTHFLVDTIQRFVDVAWRWGHEVDKRLMHLVNDPYPPYVGDSLSQAGHSGIHLSLLLPEQFNRGMSISGFAEIAIQMEEMFGCRVATPAEAMAGTSNTAITTPCQVSQQYQATPAYRQLASLFASQQNACPQ